MSSLTNNDGFRRIVNREVIAPRIHRRYKKRPPVVESDIQGDPCSFAWGEVLACYSKNNFEQVPCYSLLQEFHECRAEHGDMKARQRQIVRHRHEVRTLISLQQQASKN
eukprot:TRINITY_DN16711_c0_g1_i1.p1 TRINITY_DN16711_c0_g1~~TRINITY_DN16711_c0_g1_i1.p1  ORF type:complete len:109 (-),score=19.63 TRINITY_DN16711_c0_g1_i1:24-350(-)